MKLPEPKNDRFGFHDAVLMSWNDHVAPSSVEVAWNVSIRRLPASLRLSSHTACSVPSGPSESAAIHGKNWSFGAGAPPPSTESGTASLHVAPWSVDCTNEMSAPESPPFT